MRAFVIALALGAGACSFVLDYDRLDRGASSGEAPVGGASVSCGGGASCGTGLVCCREDKSSSAGEKCEASCTTVTIACDDARDCPSGSVCCDDQGLRCSAACAAESTFCDPAVGASACAKGTCTVRSPAYGDRYKCSG